MALMPPQTQPHLSTFLQVNLPGEAISLSLHIATIPGNACCKNCMTTPLSCIQEHYKLLQSSSWPDVFRNIIQHYAGDRAASSRLLDSYLILDLLQLLGLRQGQAGRSTLVHLLFYITLFITSIHGNYHWVDRIDVPAHPIQKTRVACFYGISICASHRRNRLCQIIDYFFVAVLHDFFCQIYFCHNSYSISQLRQLNAMHDNFYKSTDVLLLPIGLLFSYILPHPLPDLVFGI